MRLKKLAAMAVSTLMIISMSVPVFAADLNSSESSVISTLQSCNVPAEYVTQARNYFLLDDVDITADQAAALNSHIQAARSKAGNALTVSDLSPEVSRQVIDELALAASVIGLSVTYDSSSKTLLVTKGNTVILESVSGRILSGVSSGNNNSGNNSGNSSGNNSGSNSGSNTGSGTSDGIIKQTGADINITYAVVGVSALVLVGCGIAALMIKSKKEA